jgi:hypothetical protein
MTHHTFAAFLIVGVVVVGGCSKPSKSVAIEPRIAVGSVRSGMTVQQVMVELGQADLTTNSYLMYSHLGLQVTHDNEGVVQSVTIRHPFAGRTREGIGVGSSRADVIRAFGAPTVQPSTEGYEILKYYRSRGLAIQLLDGKVDEMIIHLPPTK